MTGAEEITFHRSPPALSPVSPSPSAPGATASTNPNVLDSHTSVTNEAPAWVPIRLNSHSSTIRSTWQRVQQLKQPATSPSSSIHNHSRSSSNISGSNSLLIDGFNLSIADIIAVTYHSLSPSVPADHELEERLARSVEVLNAHLARGWTVYGVNTGFGGSADARTDAHTNALHDLQISLLQHTQSAIIPSIDRGIDPATCSHITTDNNLLDRRHDRHAPHTIPRPWVRAAMLVRANQNLRGHSAVRIEVVQKLVDLIRCDITPIVPLRGTISASGDLMPLSYIAGALAGNPDIYVQLGPDAGNAIVPSSEALARHRLEPAVLGPKEGLGLINGTAPSAALAAIAIYETQQLAVLAQLLTALTAEGLAGNVEWASSFIHETRPHPGQLEAAANIRHFLTGSKLVTGLDSRRRCGDGLWQDRYSTRTAAQWLGPYLEDLALAQRQIETELNSTSDNPLVLVNESHGTSTPSGDVFSGGNFQATSITSAMEKTRLALQMIGRLLFSQVSELINPATNNGLEVNLNVVDDRSFTMKGIDVNVAAYMSELAALAHPVSAHVLSAEMHNQGVNSLAFISARRTAEAVDLVAHICAAHLFASCQAAELRTMHNHFIAKVTGDCDSSMRFWNAVLEPLGLGGNPSSTTEHAHNSAAARLAAKLKNLIPALWVASNSLPIPRRCASVADSLLTPTLHFLLDEDTSRSSSALATFRSILCTELERTALEVGLGPLGPVISTTATTATTQRAETLSGVSAAARDNLGSGTGRVYSWVRDQLGVRCHIGLDDDPLYRNRDEGDGAAKISDREKKTIGSWVTRIYESIRSGELLGQVMEAVA